MISFDIDFVNKPVKQSDRNGEMAFKYNSKGIQSFRITKRENLTLN